MSSSSLFHKFPFSFCNTWGQKPPFVFVTETTHPYPKINKQTRHIPPTHTQANNKHRTQTQQSTNKQEHKHQQHQHQPTNTQHQETKTSAQITKDPETRNTINQGHQKNKSTNQPSKNQEQLSKPTRNIRHQDNNTHLTHTTCKPNTQLPTQKTKDPTPHQHNQH
jgi:hypothetical protein